MPKQLKDILAGVKSSKVVPGSTGKDPGVDYAPKAPNEQEFVKLHKTEKHADRNGNGDDVYQATNVKYSLNSTKEPRHGYKKGEDEKVNEEAKCNMTAEGTYCPVHEMTSCSQKKPLKEVLTKKTSAGEVIKDFQKSKDPKFAGKSAEKRKQMALGAYYGMHPEKSKKTNEEAEQIDEISKKTLSSYSDKARKEIKGNQPSDPDKLRKRTNREQGIKLAYKKHHGYKSVPATESVKEDLAVPLLGGDDESAEMAKTQLRALANKALHLAMQLNDDQVVEPWVQAKIAVAKDNVSAVHDYMVYGDHSKPEDEQTAPYDGGIDMTGAPRDTLPSFSADVNTGRVV